MTRASDVVIDDAKIGHFGRKVAGRPRRSVGREMNGHARASRTRSPDVATCLTPSEAKVLALLSTYRTLAGIGDQLGIARATVRTHVQHIYKKLGATNRAEAVQSAVRAGLLPAPEIHQRRGVSTR